MNSKILALILFSLISYMKTISQNLPLPTTPITYGSLNSATPLSATFSMSDVDRDRFIKPSTDKILLSITGAAGKKITVGNNQPISGTYDFDVTRLIRTAINNLDDHFDIDIKETNAAGVVNKVGMVKVTWAKLAKSPLKEVNEISEENRKRIITAFRSSSSFNNPYNSKTNRIDLFFDEKGNLLNYLPVNVDQNDIFVMHILCVKGEEEKYSINIIEGEYAPVDLAIRPSTKLSTDLTKAQGTDEENIPDPIVYSFTTLRAGPFTSDNFKFQISYTNPEDAVENSKEYSLKVNKLFHVGVGVSLISTSLAKPDFKTVTEGGQTTIQAFNGGRRTLFTFNVIWYWTIFHQNKKGSVIPNGRDILKDEASYSGTRLFPTLGVTLDNNFKENFLVGAVYEFARGGSLIAGLHYGRINKLLNKNVGDLFTGTDADIKTTQVYKTGFFFGVNLDTRIINTLFARGQ